MCEVMVTGNYHTLSRIDVRLNQCTSFALVRLLILCNGCEKKLRWKERTWSGIMKADMCRSTKHTCTQSDNGDFCTAVQCIGNELVSGIMAGLAIERCVFVASTRHLISRRVLVT